MTVSYTGDVGNASIFGLAKLLTRWKGSLWKAVYMELLLWIMLYAILSLTYFLALNDQQKRVFEGICAFFHKYAELVPITFMLGFFVSVVIGRWWNMFDNLGWIDIVAMFVSNHVHGSDEHARMLRRNIIRYLLFYQVLVFRDISICIRERFPTLQSCVAAGYITQYELSSFEGLASRYPQYWTPIQWTMNSLRRAYREGRIHSSFALHDLQRRVMDFRNNLGTLLGYDWVPVPLVYSQVVTLCVRIYFLIALLGRQNLVQQMEGKEMDPINIYVPIMTIIQFVFYVGWLKVAEALLNPFGRDDDDFEVNWLLDRNLEVGYMIVDTREELPLIKDAYWEEKNIDPLYTEDTVNVSQTPMIGSAVNMRMRTNSHVMVPRTLDDDQENMSRSNSIFALSPIQAMQKRLSRARNSISPEENSDGRCRKFSTVSAVAPPPSHFSSCPGGELHVVVEEEEEENRKKSRLNGIHSESATN